MVVGGLIGTNSSGAISNCTASGYVYGLSHTGGLIGENTGNISSCSATGNTQNTDTNDSNYAGGLIAYNTGIIVNCYATGAVRGRNEGTGGLVGYNTGHISYSQYTVSAYLDTISGHNLGVRGVNQCTGGFVGYNNGAIIEYCYVILNGSLTETLYIGAFTTCGGFAGHNTGTIRFCYAAVPVYGWNTYYYGGFVGTNEGTISNCYARGNVSGSGTEFSGGFVGYHSDIGSISYCYETGTVSGTSQAYGFSGSLYPVTYSYYNIVNASNDVGIGVPLSSMIVQSTFSGWNFTSIWTINPSLNNNFPYLQAIPPVN